LLEVARRDETAVDACQLRYDLCDKLRLPGQHWPGARDVLLLTFRANPPVAFLLVLGRPSHRIEVERSEEVFVRHWFLTFVAWSVRQR
jgi:hypothetical protein